MAPSELLSFDLIAEPENKLTSMTTKQYVSQFERSHLRDGKMSLKFLVDDMRADIVTFPITWYSPFYDVFNDKIGKLVEAGICPRRLGGRVEWTDFVPERIDTKVPPLVLNMEDLEIGFLICLIPLTLSVVAFIGELVMSKIETLATETRNLFTFLYLISNLSKNRIGLN